MITLTTYSSSKFEHSNEFVGWLTAGIYLDSGKRVCPFMTPQCGEACLKGSGRVRMNPAPIQAARIERTRLLFEERESFYTQLRKEIKAHIRKAKRNNVKPAFRLNATSDIRFDVTGIMAEFPEVQFYDYTKWPYRLRPNATMPENYHLTYSRSELTTDAEIDTNIVNGRNVTVVFSTKRGHALPDTWNGHEVIDGDIHDLRFLDPKGVIVGLRFKPSIKNPKPVEGFVVMVD